MKVLPYRRCDKIVMSSVVNPPLQAHTCKKSSVQSARHTYRITRDNVRDYVITDRQAAAP